MTKSKGNLCLALNSERSKLEECFCLQILYFDVSDLEIFGNLEINIPVYVCKYM